ncbi:MAG: DUF6020 family protein [Parolsenella sp.]|uniref:DUF6020 family protein n=1 Tax=Parolsenella sp. TaxID=2083006 RepID=UPI002A755F6F|nr:DUF6020 family protein [Parolsenella sp.]MCI5950134.1 DUF6020 family protein [Coriobacteriaceae bacterium]MDY3292077.1 DUF6020 family protein [Parolsenella sp.]
MDSTINRKIASTLLFSLPSSTLLAFGLSYSFRHTCAPTSKLTVGAFICLSVVLSLFFFLTVDRNSTREVRRQNAHGLLSKSSPCYRHPFLLSFLVLLTAWLPYYLASFPGLYVYDAITQTQWALRINLVTSWHPLAHTYWLSGLMELGYRLFGSYDIGFALYTTSQYVLFAALLSCFISKLHLIWHNATATIATVAFFGLFPMFPIMAVSSTKDTIFSASFALCAIELLYICRTAVPKRDYCLFFVSGILVSCFRNNGFYALAIALVILIIAKHNNRRIVFTSVLLIMSGLALALLIPKLVSDDMSSSTEMLGVPIQQVCRAAINHYDELNEVETNALERTIPSWQNYMPATVDPVKFSGGTAKAIESNKSTFFRLWLALMQRYPEDYLDALYGLINGWLSPAFTYSSFDTTKPYFEFDSWEIEEKGMLVRRWQNSSEHLAYDTANVIEVHRISLFPGFEPIMRSLCYSPFWTGNLAFTILTSVALPIYLLYYMICVSIFHKEVDSLVVLLFASAYVATCLLGPVFLPRYALPVYSIYPLLIALCMCEPHTSESKTPQIEG